MKQKFLLFIQIVLLCVFFPIKTNYVLSQETYDFAAVEESSNLSNNEDISDKTNIQLDNEEVSTGVNTNSGNIYIMDDETIELIVENDGNQDTK
jgi:hypothetical protein